MTAFAVAPSPFKGLSPFGDTETDAFLFFGRSRETETIVANLQAARITILFGPTGVGKTSILRAGVAHRLHRQDGARVEVVNTWSDDAVRPLRSALSAAADEDLYVILDQFEEYFNYARDDEAFAAALAEVVLDPGSRVNVLIGIRDDALARLDVFKGRIPTLLGNRLRLERLDRRAASEAIVRPIEAYNRGRSPEEAMAIEPELVDAILDEVAVGRVRLGSGGSGAAANGAGTDRIEAAFLQLVLERLWETERARASRLLRLSTLRELGGAATIVRDHLDQAMASLSDDERDAAAAMYEHLVTPSGTKIAHDVADLAGYASVDEPAAARVLEKLAGQRVLRSANGSRHARYEIYHDVLADAVLGWRARYEADRAVRDAERRRRRALVIAAAAILALIVVAAFAVFALLERSHARAEARHARAGRLVAEARSDMENDPQTSIALALAAARQERTSQVEDALRDALIASRLREVFVAPAPVVARGENVAVVGDATGRVRVISYNGELLHETRLGARVTSTAVAGDGTYAAGTADGRIVRAHRDLLLVGRRVPVTAVALAPPLTVAGTASGNVVLWLRNRVRMRMHVRGRIGHLLFSRDRRWLLVVSRDRRARLVDVHAARIARTLPQRGYVTAAAFSPDARLVVTASADRTARVWNVGTGTLVREFPPAGEALNAVAVSDDGKTIALASSDGVARAYATQSGALRYYLSGDRSAITDIGFDPAGRAVVTSSADRTVRIWTTDVGRLLTTLRGHSDAATRAFFSTDGRRVVSAGADATVRIWDPGTEPELRVVVHQHSPFARATRRSDGTIAVLDRSGHTMLLDPTASHVVGRRGERVGGSAANVSVGETSARANPDGTITLAHAGKARRLDAHADAVALSPDGRLLTSGGRDGYLRMWETASGRQHHAVVAHQGPVRDVEFSPDGRWVVTAGPISAGIWSVPDVRLLLLLHGPTKPLRAALFTRDGHTVVAAGLDGTIRRYDCTVCGTLPELIRVAQARLAQTRPR